MWARLAHMGEALYGSAASVDPRAGYEGKAAPAVLHQDRNALKDALGICDNIFPLMTHPETDDLMVEVDGVAGPLLEHYLFTAASDLHLTADEFYKAGTRIFTAERLLAMRNWSRSRRTDETIVSYLSREEGSVNPYIGHKVTMDPAGVRGAVDRMLSTAGLGPGHRQSRSAGAGRSGRGRYAARRAGL